MDQSYLFLIIIGIIFLIITIIIILFSPNETYLNITTSQVAEVTEVTDTVSTSILPVASGVFIINNQPSQYNGLPTGSNAINLLLNVENLTFTTSDSNYIIQSGSYGNGFQPLKLGKYSFEITFNILQQNRTNQDFNVFSLINFTSSTESLYSVYYIDEKINGPEYAQVNQINFCTDNNTNGYFATYRQKDAITTNNPSLNPLILMVYDCKTDGNNNAYTNYYTFTGIMNITGDVANLDTYPSFYLQFAFNGGGSFMTGTGTISINYLNLSN